MTITAILPAYNEIKELPLAVAALQAQTTPPDRIIIALNNSHVEMRIVAWETGADVWYLGKCPGLKAEALNRTFRRLLQTARPDDVFIVADADGTLAPTWIETALQHVDPDTVVGGVFLGEDGGGWLGKCQRNEYRAYARELYARRDRAYVLTGTATAFTAAQAHAVTSRRGRLYDEDVQTEDFELTVAFKRLGYRCTSPVGTEVTTEVMPTVRTLVSQRTRWYRGAVETLRLHGVNRVTAPYLWQQARIVAGLTLGWLAIGLVAYFAIAGDLSASWLWLIAIVPIAARVITGQHHLFSLLVVPELIYDMILQVALVRGWCQAFTARGPRVWNTTEKEN